MSKQEIIQQVVAKIKGGAFKDLSERQQKISPGSSGLFKPLLFEGDRICARAIGAFIQILPQDFIDLNRRSIEGGIKRFALVTV